MWLGPRVAVALASAGGYSSDGTPSLGTSICRGPKKDKKKKSRAQHSGVLRFLVFCVYNLDLQNPVDVSLGRCPKVSPGCRSCFLFSTDKSMASFPDSRIPWGPGQEQHKASLA